jgi:hypothetical protein
VIVSGPVKDVQVKVVLKIWSLQDFEGLFADSSLLRYFGFGILVVFYECSWQKGSLG